MLGLKLIYISKRAPGGYRSQRSPLSLQSSAQLQGDTLVVVLQMFRHKMKQPRTCTMKTTQ